MTRRTSAPREAWVGRRLGLDGELAERLVARLVAEDRLHDGGALLLVLHAARRGSEPPAAAAELVSGARKLPSAPSPYELRTVGDEVDDRWTDEPDDPEPSVADADAVTVSDAHLR